MNKIYSLIRVAVLIILIVFTILILQYLLIQKNSLKKKDISNSMHTEKLDNLIDDTIHAIPIKGLSANITKGNNTIYSKQFGKGIDEHTSFILGSTSKSITAATTLMMIHEYKQDAPASWYTCHELNINDSANKYLQYIDPDITLLDLLNHTSGISTYEKINHIKYLGKHGTFEYSNTNYNILGEIIAEVTGGTYLQYVQKQIFNRLNMNDSFALTEKTSDNIIPGYQSYFGFPIQRNPEIPN